MSKTLGNLIRLHKYRVDEKRRRLGELYGELGVLEQKLKDLETQVLEEQRISKESPDQALFSYGRFHQRAMGIRETLHGEIVAKEEEVEIARDGVNEAFRELKIYEEAEKARLKKEKEELTRKENIEMDEIAQNLFRRYNED